MNEKLYKVRDTLLEDNTFFGEDEESVELIRDLGHHVNIFYDNSSKTYEVLIASNGTIILTQEEAHKLFVERVMDCYKK